MEEEKVCRDCKYWEQLEDNKWAGYCSNEKTHRQTYHALEHYATDDEFGCVNWKGYDEERAGK